MFIRDPSLAVRLWSGPIRHSGREQLPAHGRRPAAAKDVGDMIAHGLWTQHQSFGDSQIVVALRDQVEDFALAVGQLGKDLRRLGPWALVGRSGERRTNPSTVP